MGIGVAAFLAVPHPTATDDERCQFLCAQHTLARPPDPTEDLEKVDVPRLPGTGLLLTSADAHMRFLPVDAGVVLSPELLREKPVSELGALADRVTPIAR